MTTDKLTTTNEKFRVLILDDDLFFSELLSEMLRSIGYTDILLESDGNRALQTIKSQTPDILFCDIDMPGMDGIEFLRHLVIQDYTGNLLLMSGAIPGLLKAVERLAISHGLNLLGSLDKPFELNVLAELIAKPHQSIQKSQGYAQPKKLTAKELHEGLHQARLVLLYQPKVAVYGRHVPDAECLARWQHPEYGLLGPDSFIGVAEETGSIGELTQIVLDKAATNLSLWRQTGSKFRLAINVSMINLCRLDLPEIFEKIVQSKGLKPEDFILEVTESRLVNNLSVTLEILTRLRLKGFGLSIDDFGTGYSTMESLMHLPFTELKLDRKFVSGAAENSSARAILESSVRLGRALKLNLVAEGVENRQDWGVIAGLGCHEMQGYLIAKPMAADKLLEWVRRWENETKHESTTLANPNPETKQAAKILAVDDDEFISEMYDAALGDKYRIIFAKSSKEALVKAQTESPDLILMDVEMPGMDGYESCQELKALEITANIPVIFVSGHDLIEDRIKGYEAGGMDYITKPFNPFELETKVTYLLEIMSERARFKDIVGHATTTAMTAMTSMSEMGILLESMKSFYATSDYQALADAMLAGIELYGLRGVIQIRTQNQTLTRNHQGEASPLEISVIEHMTNMDRIVQFKSRLSITYNHVTLLVNNLPKNDDEACGRLRDHLAMLVEAAEIKVQGINDSIKLSRRGEAIAMAVEVITETLNEVDAAQRENRIAACMAANNLKDDMEKALLKVGLSESEDEYMTSIIQDGTETILSTQNSDYEIQDKLSGIIHDLKALLN